MALDEEIRDRFVTDTETILEAHLDDLDGMFQFHEDGTLELLGEYRDLRPRNKILLYLIAKRYKYEGGLADTGSVEYSEIYPRFPDKKDSTVRGYFMDLRKDGFATKSDTGHELSVERLPEAIERIESEVSGE